MRATVNAISQGVSINSPLYYLNRLDNLDRLDKRRKIRDFLRPT